MVYVIPDEKLIDFKQKSKYRKGSQENIFKSIKFFMVCFQMLGILPQENITTSQNELRFTWKSFRAFYSLFCIGLTAFALVVCFLDWFYVGYAFTALVTNVFYTGALATLILHLRLATSWSKLIILWCKVDKIMNNSYGYPKSLDKKLRTTAVIYLSLGLADFGLSVLNRYNNVYVRYGNEYNAEKFYFDAFPQMFRHVPFSMFSATICSLIQVHATLVWTANDLFIILMSTALALRFKQICDRLVSNQKMIKSHRFWIEIREDYDRLSILCKNLDNHISYIILLSFSWNIFFLLVQLYHSLEAVNGFIGKTYFIFSFIYLIIKLVSVSLYAAWINDESVEPASILNSVPASTYNIEIAGAIVTYELVLIQFNSATA